MDRIDRILYKTFIYFAMLPLFAGVCGAEKSNADADKTVEDEPAAVRINIPATGVYAKMEAIIFPSVEFDDADLFSVVRYLNRSSKRYDPSKAGVGIVIAGITKEEAGRLPKITMHLSKIPMSEILRYVCQSTGLKFKIDEGVVVIGVDVDEMVTGYFNVRGDLASDITGVKSEDKEKKNDPRITGSGAKADFTNTFKR